MSTITFKKFYILIFAVIAVTGCVESQREALFGSAQPRGIVAPPVSVLPEQSGFSYHGAGQRNLGLKFIISGRSDRTITAVVVLPEYLDFKNQTLNYRWQLDEDIKILEGPATGAIMVQPNQKRIQIKLTVNNFSTTLKKFIRFEASSDVIAGVKKSRFFIDGIVSSQSESSFENFVQGIENYKKKVHYENEK